MSITPDAVREEIVENSLVVGNPVKTAAKLKALGSYLIYSDSNSNFASSEITASKPVYTDSSSVPQTGAFPFAVPMSAASTTAAFLDVTGASTLSATGPLNNSLVSGGAVTTFTATGYVRVTITDDGGNITSGQHYIQVGTLA